MRKIVLLGNASYSNEVRRAAPGWAVVAAKDADAARPLVAEAEVLAGFVGGLMDACIASPTLRWIQSWSAGVDDFPLEQLKRKGIALTTGSGVHGQPISESVFGMMLSFARALHTSIRDQARAQWRREHHDMIEIHGMTLGVLGAGAIGQEIARIGRAFGMRVLGLRRSAGEAPHFDRVYAAAEIDALLPPCDCVVNVLPHTAETHRLMDARRFALMKRASWYISVGRGQTTDQAALIDALASGHVACAGLDVTDPEPLPPASPLWAMDNVIITPHISGSTDRYTERASEIFLENLGAYIQTGRPVRNVVDYDRQY